MTRSDRTGAIAAIAAAVFSVAVVALVIGGLLHGGMGSDGPPLGPADRLLAVVLGLAIAGLALAQAICAASLDGRLRPPSWVSRLGLVAVLAGAGVQIAGAVLSMISEARGAHDPLASVLIELAPVGVGAWAICVSAAAWRARLWATGTRVVGAVFGAAAMTQPGFPPAGAISLLAGLAWWIALSREFGRSPRSTAG